MKKILYIFAVVLLTTSVGKSQISLPYSMGFEVSSTFINDGWGMWYESSDTSNLHGFGITYDDAYAGTYSFLFSSFYLLSDNLYAQYLVTPKINASNNIKISFWYNDNGDASETFRIGYSSDVSFVGDFSNFSWLAAVTSPADGVWHYYEAIVPAGTTYISIKYDSYYQYYLMIDNVNLTETTAAISVNYVDLGFYIADYNYLPIANDTVQYGYGLDMPIYWYNWQNSPSDYNDIFYLNYSINGIDKGNFAYEDYTGSAFTIGSEDYYTLTSVIPYDSIVAWGLLGQTVEICIDMILESGWVDQDTTDNYYCYYVTFEDQQVINTYTITASAGVGGSISPAGTTTVQQGGSQTYTITPASCYFISNVFVNGVSVGAVGSYTFTNVQANATILASFTQQTYTVTVTVGANGTASYGTYTFAAGSTQNITLNCGDQPTFNFYPDGGYQINDVTINGSSQGSVPSYQFPSLNANSSVNVSFSQIPAGTYIVSASSGIGGTISPNGTSNYSAGANATYTIAADSCYTIDDVLVDGVSVGAVGSYTFSNIQANATITASFQITTYNVTVSASAGGSVTCGTYTVPAGQTLAIPVNCGDQPVFTFHPDNGYQVGSVVVDNANVGTATTYQMPEVGSNSNMTVTFISSSANSYTITATAGNGGAISPSGTSNYSEGSSATYTITPNNCYDISDVLVNGSSVGALASYTFNNIQSNQSIYVTFVQKTYTITVTAGMGGSIVYNGLTIAEGTTQQITVDCGSNAVFTFVPNDNFSVGNVLVDGNSVGNGNTYTFGNVSGDGTLNVEFKEGVSVTEYAAGFNLWPNPASDVLNIDFMQSGDFKVVLLNLLGEVAGEWGFASANCQINLSDLSTGVYFVRVTSQNGIVTRKFVKE